MASLGAPQQISTGFVSCLRYCSDVAHRRPTEPCTMFDRLVGCYTIYTFSEALAPNIILPGGIFTLRPSLAFSYRQRYCPALQQRASAKLCGVVQGMELPNFRRGRHLYSARRPSCWASAHILVIRNFCAVIMTLARGTYRFLKQNSLKYTFQPKIL